MLVTVDNDGDTDTHIVCVDGCYATLCGMDGDDPEPGVNQKILEKTGDKITCWMCKNIWEHCRSVPEDLFE